MISLIISLALIMGNVFGGTTVLAAENTPATTTCTKQSFFSLPTWHKYLPTDDQKSALTGKCEVDFTLMENGVFNGNGLLLVGLAILDILVRAAGLIALGFIVFGGFKYITSQGSPENTKAAFSTILNAVIGLVVALVAVAIVSFIGTSIG